MTNDQKYYVVTTVSMFRNRFVVPVDELQKENTEAKVEPMWAADAVTMNEVDEFSQLHIAENITDVVEMDEEEVLDLFDKDNDYLKEWDREQKIKHIRDWKAKW